MTVPTDKGRTYLSGGLSVADFARMPTLASSSCPVYPYGLVDSVRRIYMPPVESAVAAPKVEERSAPIQLQPLHARRLISLEEA